MELCELPNEGYSVRHPYLRNDSSRIKNNRFIYTPLFMTVRHFIVRRSRSRIPRRSHADGALIRIIVVLFFFPAMTVANSQTANNPLAKLASTVTIYRDKYGVPHVFGRTDASTAFGFAYAQAEDNFWRVEENFINALGRASEVYGDQSLDEDRLNHALEIPRLAREEYGRLDAHMRSLCDAYAAGFNYYLERHTEVKPRLLTK